MRWLRTSTIDGPLPRKAVERTHDPENVAAFVEVDREQVRELVASALTRLGTPQ
jgi:hypothetical protein